MSNVINDLVHLGTFDENTDEEYVNYQVHEALKKAEKIPAKIKTPHYSIWKIKRN